MALPSKERIILVTGATGQQGGATARQLLADGWHVRAMTRAPDGAPARALAEAGAETVYGDPDRPDTMVEAFRNVYGVFSVQAFFGEDVAHEIAQGRAIADAAAKADVEHFVYTSVESSDRATGVPHFDSKFELENYAKSLSLPLSVLRPAFFMDNFATLPDFRAGVLSGTLALPLPADVPLHLIATSDIGKAAAAVFRAREEFLGRAVGLAAEALTGPEICRVFSGVLGREIAYAPFPVESLKDTAREFYLMFSWFRDVGYGTDIAACRQLLPDILSLEDWARGVDWSG